VLVVLIYSNLDFSGELRVDIYGHVKYIVERDKYTKKRVTRAKNIETPTLACWET